MTPFTQQSQRMADLLLFAKVVERGSLTGAAQALGLGKSAVSKQIRRLEQDLGSTLLHRTTRRLSLTEVGRALLEHAQTMVGAANAAGDTAAARLLKPSGRLRVTASVTYGRHVLVPLVPRFLRQHPAVELELVLVDRYVDLWEEGLDLALRLTEAPPPSLAGRPLHAWRFVLCGTPAFLRRHRVRTPQDLAQVPCMAFGAGGATATSPWQLRRGAERVQVPVRGPVAANSSDAVRELVLANLGLGLLPTFVVQNDLDAGRLRPVLPAWTPEGPFATTAWALWQPQRAMATKLRAMVDFLVKELSAPEQAP
jgi:DNA-binding transcriptional LysR family regulator